MMTLAGTIRLLEKWFSSNSNARLPSKASGRATAPALNPRFMEKKGMVRATSPAIVKLANGIGLARTHLIMAPQIPPPSDSRPKNGMRNLFTLSPIKASKAGSRVRDAIIATKTTIMAPNAMDMNVKSLVRVSPASDKITVTPT